MNAQGGYQVDKVSEYIRQQREARNITLEEMSKGTLISVSTLKDIESGRFDKYKGDESYIKMYLKKISKFLEVDANEVTQLVDDYVALTQEIELHDVQMKQEKKRLMEENKKNITAMDKLGETFREVKTTSSISRRKRKHVYEDNFLKRYLKYGIIVALCAGIVFVVWYSMVASKSDSEDNYIKPETPAVEENQDETNNNSQKEDDDEAKTDVDNENQEATALNITNIEQSSYNIGLKAGETFKLEITFSKQSAFKLWLGGSPIDESYKTYNANETYVYETQITGNEKYTLNIWDLDTTVIKINGNVLEYNKDDVRVKDGVSFFTLYMKGE